MNQGRIFTWVLVAFLSAFLLVSYQHALSQQSAEEMYEEAMFKKESEGDLNGAIQILLRITKEYPSDKKIAGKAQLQIGMCYEKLGKEEAIKAYELVLKNFADQPELVASAKARITALQKAEPLGPVVEKLPKVMEVPSFSPDGTKIAGIDWSVPGQNISVYDFTTGKQTALTDFEWTGERAGITYYPCFSSDGKEVAYWCETDSGSELRVSTLDGKGRTLYRRSGEGSIIPCDWLPDGSAIVVLKPEVDKSFTLGLVPSLGGDLKTLRKLEPAGPPMIHPSVSPDGRFIAFTELSPEKSLDIKIMTIDGEVVGILTDHPANDTEACWSPDGKHIAFVSNRHGGRGLWGLEVKDGKPAGKPFMIKSEMSNSGLLKWTSKGLACQMFVMTWDIFLMPVDPKTGEPLDKAHMLGYTPTGDNTCPRWSPDGKYLAFASKKKGGPRRANIVVVSADTGEAKEYPIPTDRYRGFLTDLSWVPDGSGLGFSMVSASESLSGWVRRLFRLKLDTAEWETWDIPCRFGGTWGPDGSTYVFEKRSEEGEEQGIVQWNPYSGEERVLYRIPEGEKHRTVRGLTFSHDAKKLIFSLDNYKLMVLDMETGNAKTVGEDFMSPVWSPDDRLILALDSWEEGWPKTMFVLPAEGGERTELELGGKLPKDSHLLKPHWSSDGKQIVFGTRYSIHEAFLLKNVLPKK